MTRRPAHMPQRWGTLRVLERIGHGAFGEVYRAWDSRLDREVALKLLAAGDRDRRGPSIIEEGRLLARVRHPNVVTIHGAERIEGRVGLWMELVKGRTLQQLVDEGRRFSAAETARIGAELADAVEAVHAAGLLHRDIKPSNVMLAEDGRVVLMDFGTGRELEAVASTGLAGTPLFLAPELLAGGAATVRSDVYSLGVVLYNMLTGAYPVRAESLRELRVAHTRSAAIPLGTLRADLPKRLTRVIERAIHPDPASRHESAGALARDLRAAMPVPLGTKVRRGAIAATLLAALAVPVAMGLLWERETVVRPAPPRELTRLTFGPGLQTDVAWSPDGERIAYASDRAGSMDIWVQPVSGGEPRRLTSSPAADTQPAWSPDGTSIVFRSEREGGGLFVISVESSETRRLTSFGYLPMWSPDGQSISFHVHDASMMAAFVVPADGSSPPSPILEEFLKGSVWIWLAPHPDGMMSALGRHRTHGFAFFTLNQDGTGLTISRVPADLATASGWTFSPVRFHWSPSGTTLYLEVVSNALPSLWKVRAAGGAIEWRTAERLTTGAARAAMAAVSPDGGRLAFTSDRVVRRAWIYPIDPQLGELTGEGRPVTSEDVEVGSVALSPNARMLFYHSATFGSRRSELVRIDLETGDSDVVLRGVGGPEGIGAPVYSRNGGRVGYIRYRQKDGQLAKVGAKDGLEFMLLVRELGGLEQALSSWMDTVFLPFHWTSDGRALLGSYRSGGYPGPAALALWPAFTPAREKPERILLDSPDHDFWLGTFSPDDRWVSFFFVPRDNLERHGIGLIPAEGSATGGWTRIATDHDAPDKPRWAPDGRTLYFLSRKPTGYFNLWGVRIDSMTGRPASESFQVTHFDSPEFMIDPDMPTRDMLDLAGERLVLTMQNVTGSIWMLSDLDEAGDGAR